MSEGSALVRKNRLTMLLAAAVVVLLVAVVVLAAYAVQPPKEKVTTVAIDAYVFKDPSFSFQFLRALSAASYGGADFGECIETAKRITEGDFESWCTQWTATAQRIKTMGDTELTASHNASAAECYMRAANYFRTAEFYLHGNRTDPRIVSLSDEARALFIKSLQLSKVGFEEVNISYEGTTLPGIFYRVDDSGAERATLIILNGFDGTKEELYGSALAATKRGYNVLVFDGPGQGEVVRNQHLYFRADWEKVISPVIDHLENRTDVDADRIALWGISMGGYLAPRAAAFDHRLAALICDGGVYDLIGGEAMPFYPGTSMKEAKAEFVYWLATEPANSSYMFYGMMAKSPTMKWSIEHGMYVFNQSSPAAYMLAQAQMSMMGLAGNITCPTLVCDGTNDTAIPKGQATMLYTNLTCPKTFHLFDMLDGAGYHCQIGAGFQSGMVKLDWLETVMPA